MREPLEIEFIFCDNLVIDFEWECIDHMINQKIFSRLFADPFWLS